MKKNNNTKDLLEKISSTVELYYNRNISLIEKDILLQNIRILYSEVNNWQIQEKETILEVQDDITETKINSFNTEKKQVVQVVQPSIFPENEKKTLGEKLNTNRTSINDILAQKKKQDISNFINQQPVSDIKLAMGIGDRFLFIRELFNGNSNLYEETINELNTHSSFEDAKTYLFNSFSWNENNETVNTFLEIIKRKWL